MNYIFHNQQKIIKSEKMKLKWHKNRNGKARENYLFLKTKKCQDTSIFQKRNGPNMSIKQHRKKSNNIKNIFHIIRRFCFTIPRTQIEPHAYMKNYFFVFATL